MNMKYRVVLGLVASGLTLLAACQPEAPGATKAPAKALDRPASASERDACLESTDRGEPPANGDCSRVPKGEFYEDDPWGRWNCRIHGNRICAEAPTQTKALTEAPTEALSCTTNFEDGTCTSRTDYYDKVSDAWYQAQPPNVKNRYRPNPKTGGWIKGVDSVEES